MIYIRKSEIILYIWLALLAGILIGSAYTHWDIADSIEEVGAYEPSVLGNIFYHTDRPLYIMQEEEYEN